MIYVKPTSLSSFALLIYISLSLMYLLNNWHRQGPPSQYRSIVLIEDLLKWSIRRNSSTLSDRRLCISLTNNMPQKNNAQRLLPFMVTINKSLSSNMDQRPCYSLLAMKAGMCHPLLSGLLIDPIWCQDRRRERKYFCRSTKLENSVQLLLHIGTVEETSMRHDWCSWFVNCVPLKASGQTWKQ